MNWRNLKIRICASKKDVATVENLLDTLDLTGNEYADRTTIQDVIDNNKLKTDILYNGNTIVSKTRILTELKKILKKKPCEEWNMSDYFYQFLHLNCGSIAHYDKRSWIYEYPTVSDLKKFFNKNEWGNNILQCQPSWKSDCRILAKEVLDLVNKPVPLTEKKLKFNDFSMYEQISLLA